MMVNNSERLKIWQNSVNQFDYAEFKAACDVVGVEPLQPMVFAQKIGILLCAQQMYPADTIEGAYLRFIQNNQYVPTQNSIVVPGAPQTVVTKACGNCGGGAVR